MNIEMIFEFIMGFKNNTENIGIVEVTALGVDIEYHSQSFGMWRIKKLHISRNDDVVNKLKIINVSSNDAIDSMKMLLTAAEAMGEGRVAA